jgi:hypothetical protein
MYIRLAFMRLSYQSHYFLQDFCIVPSLNPTGTI